MTINQNISYYSSFSKLVSIAFLCCMLPLVAFSQDNNASSTDSLDAHTLLRRAQRALEQNQSHDAIEWARQAYLLSKNDSTQQITLSFILARAYKKMEEYAYAIDQYLQIIKVATASGSMAHTRMANAEMGALYEEIQDYPKALEYYQSAYEMADTFTVKRQLLADIAHCYTQMKAYPQAIARYQDLLTLSNDDAEATLYILRQLVTLYQQTQQPAAALRVNQQMLTIYRKKGDIQAIASIQNNIGYSYSRLQQYDSALQYFQQTLFLDNQLQEGQDLRASSLINMGITYQNMGEVDKAVSVLQEALAIKEQQNKYNDIASIHDMIANIYLLRNDYYNAIVFSEASVKIAGNVTDTEVLLKIYHTYSELSKELNDFENALTYAKKYIYLSDSLQQAEMRKTDALAKKIEQIEKQEEAFKFKLADEELKALELQRRELELEKQKQENEVLIREKQLQEAELRRQALEKERTLQALQLAEQSLESERNAAEISDLRKERELQELRANERQSQIVILENQRNIQKLKIDQQAQEQSNLRIINVLTGIILLLILAGLVYTKRSYQKLSRQKEEIEVINHELQQKSEEIATQRDAIEHSFEALEKTHQQLKDAQSKLIASEKMASLGQLTAGIAHEINNPINFVSSNISPLKMNIEEVKNIIQLIRNLSSSANIHEDLAKLETAINRADLYTILEENDLLLDGIEEGARRTKEIVAGLRNFSRVNEDEWKMADVNEGILTTLTLLQNECKNKINVHKQLNPLPLIECQPGKLNQVFMNLFTNAIQAIDESGDIYVSTHESGDEIQIEIKDTGSGIPAEIRDRIFEPFFTTKDVGKGTGLGLAISYGIIEKHHGQISVESQPGQGTTFVILLPKSQAVATMTRNSKQIAH